MSRPVGYKHSDETKAKLRKKRGPMSAAARASRHDKMADYYRVRRQLMQGYLMVKSGEAHVEHS